MAAKKKSIDSAKLIKMVEDGVPRPEIMKTLNIKTSQPADSRLCKGSNGSRKDPRDCWWTRWCGIW